jgi:ribonucleoside-diphosphate reductase alpha chain
MRVVKRNGDYEDVSFDKVLKRIKVLSNDVNVNVFEIAQKVCSRIYDGVKTTELDELAAHMCSSLLVENPDYGVLASRIIISNHHKNTSPSFSETIQLLYSNVDQDGEPSPLISEELYDIVMKNKEKLNTYIDYSRDYNFDYFGFKTLERSYLMKINNRIVERPQQMWMRVALGIHGKDFKDALQTYDLMSRKYFTHATPTLFNAGTPRPQCSSCFVAGTKVYTLEGVKNIEDVQIGDMVITHMNRPRPVSQIHVNDLGDRKLFDFKAFNTPIITATDNHSFMSITCEQEGWGHAPQWNTLEHLRVGDYIEIPQYTGEVGYEVIDLADIVKDITTDGNKITYEYKIDPDTITVRSTWRKHSHLSNGKDEITFRNKALTFNRRWIVDEDFCKFLGIWYGDGHVMKQKNSSRQQVPRGIGITIDKRNLDLIDFCVKYGERLLGFKPVFHEAKNQNVTQVIFGNIIIGRIFQKMFGEYFNNKFLYKNAHKWSRDLIEHFLCGIICADGFVTKDGLVRIAMCNPSFVRNVYNLARSRGIIVSYVETDRLYKYKDRGEQKYKTAWMTIPKESAYLCKVSKTYTDGRMAKYASPSKNQSSNVKVIEGRIFVRIMKKEPTSYTVDKVYNIGVEEDHSYMVDGIIAKNCYLLSMNEDSLSGIFSSVEECAMISKYAGGIGIHVHQIRAKGSRIKGTNGTSDGLVPMLRVFNNVARYVNQSGRRNGSIAVYLEPWHADIEKFIELRKNHGHEEDRCRDLFLSLWVPDLFMERVKNNDKWCLMCPNQCPGLSDVYGEEFEQLYTKYEKAGKFMKQMNAQDLWFKILENQIETGVPYVCFKDHANRKSNQKNLGTIKSSNLCVAGDTRILTSKGYYPIKELKDQNVEVWNGKEWSQTTVHQTGVDQKLMHVQFTNGMSLKCTPYHKFYIETGTSPSSKSVPQIVEAKDLQPKMRIIRYKVGMVPDNGVEMKYAYTHGLFCADGTYSSHQGDKSRCMFRKSVGSEFCKRHLNKKKEFDDNTERCSALSYDDRPMLWLYGEKARLADECNYIDRWTHPSNRESLALPYDMPPKYSVPINCGLSAKLRWLEGLSDGDGCVVNVDGLKNIQIASTHQDFLKDVVYMLQTLGINASMSSPQEACSRMMPDGRGGSKMYECKKLYRINIDTNSLIHLKTLGFNPKRLDIGEIRPPHHITNRFVRIASVQDDGEIGDTYCFNEPKEHKGIFNGVLTSQCSEIIEYSSPDEIAVCNLSSICLPTYIEKKPDGTSFYNFEKLHEISKIVTKNLNKVIDRNYYPLEKARKSNLRHRPVGIGIQGLADTFVLLKLPFESDEAKALNKQIFETIYHGAMESSMEIAKKRHELIMEARAKNEDPTKAPYNDYLQLNEYEQDVIYTDHPGAYCTFEGSPTSQGLFQFDLWNAKPSDRYDWDALKEQVKTFGIRNSLLLAPMPTASTAQIMGFNESFEPFTSNIFKRKTLSGEFVLVNSYLIKDLRSLNLWNKEMKDLLILHEGSVQNIKTIPQNIRELYKTVWEIKQKHLVEMAADRGQYICQSQSLNIFMEDPDFKKLTSLHFYNWQLGLKTSSYYLRTRPRASAIQFTIDPKLKANHQQQQEAQPNDVANENTPLPSNFVCTPNEDGVCLMCGS